MRDFQFGFTCRPSPLSQREVRKHLGSTPNNFSQHGELAVMQQVSGYVG